MAPERRRVGRHGRRGVAFAILGANVGSLVECQVQRLAHAYIVQRRVTGVDADIGGQQRVQLQYLQFRVSLQIRDVHRARVEGDLTVAGLEPLLAYVGLGGDGQYQALDLRRPAPVIRVAAKAYLGVLGVALEDEGAGADGGVVQPLGLAAGEQMLGVFGRIDRGEAHGQVGQKGRLGMLQNETHAMLVELFDALDQLRQAHGFGVGKAAQRQLVPGMRRVELALEAPQHVVGVEGAAWREFLVGVELHSLAQGEGIAQAVIADLPALRQRRDYFGAPGGEGHQTLEQGFRRGVGGGGSGVLDDIEPFRAGFAADHQAGCLGLNCE